jgi:hypothetical protein
MFSAEVVVLVTVVVVTAAAAAAVVVVIIIIIIIILSQSQQYPKTGVRMREYVSVSTLYVLTHLCLDTGTHCLFQNAIKNLGYAA